MDIYFYLNQSSPLSLKRTKQNKKQKQHHHHNKNKQPNRQTKYTQTQKMHETATAKNPAYYFVRLFGVPYFPPPHFALTVTILMLLYVYIYSIYPASHVSQSSGAGRKWRWTGLPSLIVPKVSVAVKQY